jgi:hypothetical protein
MAILVARRDDATVPGVGFLSAHSFDGRHRQVTLQRSRQLERSPCSNSGSVGLAVQEERDLENLFLDRAGGRGATVRIKTLRRRLPHRIRDRPG